MVEYFGRMVDFVNYPFNTYFNFEIGQTMEMHFKCNIVYKIMVFLIDC